MRPTVYVETSIFSVLVARKTTDPKMTARQVVTRAWWDVDADSYELVASQAVRGEASLGDSVMAAERLAFIDQLRMVPETAAARELAEGVLRLGILPEKARTDALHVALAAVHGIGVVVTWNCRHLANKWILPRVRGYLENSGYNAPKVCTPLELPKVKHG